MYIAIEFLLLLFYTYVYICLCVWKMESDQLF